MEKEQLPIESRAKVEEHWKKMLAMPDSPEKTKYKAALQKVAGVLAKQYDLPIPEEGPFDKALGWGMHAINYGADVLSAPLKSGAALLAGEPDYAKDILVESTNPLSTKPAPTFGEVAQRLGVPQGGQLSDVVPGYAEPKTEHPWYQPERGGLLDPSLRGGLSFLADLGISPGGIASLSKLARVGKYKDLYQGMKAVDIARAQKAARDVELVAPALRTRVNQVGEAVFDPLTTLTEKGGQALYDSAFIDANRAAEEAGSQPVSDVLAKHGVWGTSSSIEQQAEDLRRQLRMDVRNKVARATEINPTGTMPRSAITGRVEAIMDQEAQIAGQTQSANKAKKKILQEFEDAYGPPSRLVPGLPAGSPTPVGVVEGLPVIPGNPYGETKFIQSPGKPTTRIPGKDSFDIVELNTMKQIQQRKAAAQRAYLKQPPNPSRAVRAADNATDAALMGDAHREVAQRARRGVEDLADLAGEKINPATGEKFHPGLGGEIYQTNQELSSLLAAEDALNKAARKPVMQSIRQSGPVALAGGLPTWLLYKENPAAALTAAAMAAGLTTTAARTGLGLGLMRTAPYLGTVGRTAIINRYGPPFRQPSPWQIQEE